MVIGMRRNDIICDCCGKVLTFWDRVELRGKGITFVNGLKIDVCNECWLKILEYINNEKRIKEV